MKKLFISYFQEIEAKYDFEMEKMNKKLKWYAENQKLLDKDTKRLRDKDDEIHRLKMKLEDFQTEVGEVYGNTDVWMYMLSHIFPFM